MLAYGIISIISFLLFITWALATAPTGPKQVPANGNPFILASVLVGAFELHDFLAQNIMKNPKRNEYSSVVRYTFFIGGLVFIFVSYGSFGTKLNIF